MKLRPSIIFFFLCLLPVSCTKDYIPDTSPDGDSSDKHGIAYLYDSSVIPEIHVEVAESEWNALLSSFDKDSGTKTQIHCDVVYDKDGEKTTVHDAGLRLKGNTSRRRPEGANGQAHKSSGASWHHCHYQLNFYKFVKDDDHKVHGAEKVTLKWFKDDPSYAREPYCYDLFRRAGVWTASNSTYCRLYVHVTGDPVEVYLGIYDMIEPVDEDYLKVRKADDMFGNASGNLWKCRYGATLASLGSSVGADIDDGKEYTYELKTNVEGFSQAKAQLSDFIKNLNSLDGEEFKTWISSVCDVPLLLKTYAVNVTVGMWDDYWNNSNNYYLYFNSTEQSSYKVWFIPYDYDNTLGTSSNCGAQSNSATQNPLKWGDGSKNPLIEKILRQDEYLQMYKSDLLSLVESGGLADFLTGALRIRSWQESIGPYVANDTGEDMVVEDRPASWGNHPEFRISDTGADNFLRQKKETIKTYCQ